MNIFRICAAAWLSRGYLAIAPELYFRQGDANDYTDIGELFQQLVTKVPDRQVLSDLDHAAHWAIRHGGDAGKLAITGFAGAAASPGCTRRITRS